MARGDLDLCLLNPGLPGRNGFDLLDRAAPRPFPTIVVSAQAEWAVQAFEYGVVDFVPRPRNGERLRQALGRAIPLLPRPAPAKFLSFRKGSQNGLLPVAEIVLLKAMRYLVEVWMRDGRRELIETPLNQLEKLLPEAFVRIHRSYIISLDQAESYEHRGGSRYAVRLKSGAVLPLSRRRLPRLKRLFGRT